MVPPELNDCLAILCLEPFYCLDDLQLKEHLHLYIVAMSTQPGLKSVVFPCSVM